MAGFNKYSKKAEADPDNDSSSSDFKDVAGSSFDDNDNIEKRRKFKADSSTYSPASSSDPSLDSHTYPSRSRPNDPPANSARVLYGASPPRRCW